MSAASSKSSLFEQSDVCSIVSPALTRLWADIHKAQECIEKPGAVLRAMSPIEESVADDCGQAVGYLREALTDLNLGAGECGESKRYPGIFALNQESLAALRAVNLAKRNLEDKVCALRLAGVDAKALRRSYALSGWPRLHPLQAWRLFPSIDRPLSKIGFVHAKHGYSIKKMSVGAAIERLLKRDALDLVEQIAALPPETLIRWCQSVEPHWLANVRFAPEQSIEALSQPIKQSLYVSLPVITSAQCWPCKEISFTGKKIRKEHKVRSDQKRNQIIWLPFRDKAFLSF